MLNLDKIVQKYGTLYMGTILSAATHVAQQYTQRMAALPWQSFQYLFIVDSDIYMSIQRERFCYVSVATMIIRTRNIVR